MKKTVSRPSQCSGCNLCQPVCPIFQQNMPDQFTPAGMMTIIGHCAENGENPPNRIFKYCSLCGKCEKACPANLPLTLIFHQNRQPERPLPFRKKMRGLFRHGLMANLFLPFFHGGKRNKGIRKALPFIHHKKSPSGKQPTVLFFPGCQIRQHNPELARKAIHALENSGFSVVSPFFLECCGMKEAPSIALGRIRKNLRLLAKTDFDWLVTPCPHCAQAIVKLWPHVAGLPEKERQTALEAAKKTRHLLRFLGDRLATPLSLPENLRLVWHNSCSLPEEDNELGIKLFGENNDISSVSACCGANCKNSFPMQPDQEETVPSEDETDWPAAPARPSFQEKLGKDCESGILGQKADLVLTVCPDCAAHINKRLGNKFVKAGKAPRAVYFLELLTPGDKSFKI